ncbi:MAG TPA: phosphatase PAP2 family protein [Anaerolineales bacterium]|nr:phosphatase PAP2 family protein [Anaerolineales bacterium]
MKQTLKLLFGEGIFGTGWKNALTSLGLVVAVVIVSQLKALLNHGPAILNLRTGLDAILPVVPIFIIPYDSLMLIIYFTLAIFFLTRTRIFQSTSLALLIAWLVSYVFYIFLQTEVLRPVLLGSDVLTRMVLDVYSHEGPFSDFPSLHASLSTIVAIHWFRVDRRLGVVVAIWTALIVTSTVMIKQHYVAGLIPGILLAFGASWASWRVWSKKA